ncbi:LCP family protein [Kitasatospora purpeofusca]|uniref:LCP family protein n=1 Tax=Kitasatospora purpeofusca TaxID=67352 RepID=UPI002A5A08A1|nr:LCP family protein [Kitasatospora purpeofusca]MDY0815563.1 LCP family protein [Kitasatospora purpeofusca]
MAEDDTEHPPTDHSPTEHPPAGRTPNGQAPNGQAPNGPVPTEPPPGGPDGAAGAGGPGDPESPGTAGAPGAPGGGRRRRRRWLIVTAGVLAFLLVGCGTLLWVAYRKLDGNIRTDSTTDQLLARLEAERPSRTAGARGAENLLLIGSDDRTGANATYGAAGGQRSDTTILLHLAADRRHATAVSIPRDVMVSVPACEKPDGSRSRPTLMQFNAAFETGGPACSIRTVEQLSGIRIDHYVIVDFAGFKRMVDAVDGVEVCVPQPIHDKDAKLDLAAGRQTLHGEQALGFVRARETLGDGSDTQRMGRQQQFLAALIRKVQSQDVLLNPTKLWPVLDAATSSVQADSGLSSLGELYDLTQDLRGIPSSDVTFLTAPRRAYRFDSDRDEFVQPQTTQLFAALRDDRPVEVRPPGSSPSAAPLGTRPTAAPSSAAASSAAAPASASASVSAPVSASASASASASMSASPSPGASGPSAFEGRTADVDACAVH